MTHVMIADGHHDYYSFQRLPPIHCCQNNLHIKGIVLCSEDINSLSLSLFVLALAFLEVCCMLIYLEISGKPGKTRVEPKGHTLREGTEPEGHTLCEGTVGGTWPGSAL